MYIGLNHFASGARRVIAFLSFILLASVACLDLQFESEYEDINGIIVEYVHSYGYIQGTKICFIGDMGYIVYAESLLIYDFAEVTEAVYQGHYIAGSIINDFQIYDDCAVLVTETGLEIVDVSDSLPVQLSAVSLFFYGTSIRIQDDNAFIVSGTQVYVADISDKQHPTLTTSIAFDHNIKQIEVDSHFAYVLESTEFCVLNIQDPNAITLVASTPLSTLYIIHPEAFFKKDSYIYLAHYTTFIAWLSTCELASNKDIQVLNDIVVPDRIRMFDVSDEYTLAVSWSAAYLLNLQHPASPCLSEETEWGGVNGTIHGDHIFLMRPWLSIFQIVPAE